MHPHWELKAQLLTFCFREKVFLVSCKQLVRGCQWVCTDSVTCTPLEAGKPFFMSTALLLGNLRKTLMDASPGRPTCMMLHVSADWALNTGSMCGASGGGAIHLDRLTDGNHHRKLLWFRVKLIRSPAASPALPSSVLVTKIINCLSRVLVILAFVLIYARRIQRATYTISLESRFQNMLKAGIMSGKHA